MSDYKRELEIKYTCAPGFTLEQVERDLCALLRDHEPYRATSDDRFWRAPGVDFVRLRANSRELTVKVTDRGTTENRIEENVIVQDLETAARLATLLWGVPLSLTKTFSVWRTKLPGAPAPGDVCLYRVEGDPERRVFLEVESSDVESVQAMAAFVSRYFKLIRETRSLFQVFFPEVA